jgi:hypothetical protein
MPPKKREKDLDGQKGSRGDNTDHELFLQAFESKPETFLFVSFYSILSVLALVAVNILVRFLS